MKIWAVKFKGFYPVGAVAVVVTGDSDSKEHAENLFKQFWIDENSRHDPHPIEAELLDLPLGAVRVLLDGDY